VSLNNKSEWKVDSTGAMFYDFRNELPGTVRATSWVQLLNKNLVTCAGLLVGWLLAYLFACLVR
jgi:hypothetical protein